MFRSLTFTFDLNSVCCPYMLYLSHGVVSLNSLLDASAGFSSMFLYKRWYRCFTALDGFSMDIGKVERKTSLTLEEFRVGYDGKKPVRTSNDRFSFIHNIGLVSLHMNNISLFLMF